MNGNKIISFSVRYTCIHIVTVNTTTRITRWKNTNSEQVVMNSQKRQKRSSSSWLYLPLVSKISLNWSFDLGISTTSMKPAGKLGSVLVLPSSTFTCFSIMQIILVSLPVKAYFNRFRRINISGRDSRSLWWPWDGRGGSLWNKNKQLI